MATGGVLHDMEGWHWVFGCRSSLQVAWRGMMDYSETCGGLGGRRTAFFFPSLFALHVVFSGRGLEETLKASAILTCAV